ncbi:HPP family protein [Notoacmeibacter marinus]|uniref:HPP family protein n=2 Tax=Notoacmeibacter marinus TaxID=1876515 RepID=A0A231V428_9HYPH|nr:HPP family protein [Notoacmeibacter marinus]
MFSFMTRHQPSQSFRSVILAGIGGLLAIAIIGALTIYSPSPLLMAPFGASCVLLFSLPASLLSQPANVIGGHLVASSIGLALRFMLPDVWWAAALAVGLAIAFMAIFRLTHPPAGADPLVIFAADPALDYLFFPVLSGSCVLVLVASVFHRASGVTYPIRKA